MPERFGIHRLVNHAGYLAVAAYGQPAYSVLGLPLFGLGEKLSEPCHARGEKLEASGIEEKEELVHLDVEDTRPEEMPGLMDCNEYGQRQDKLQDFNQHNHRAGNRDLAMRKASS